MTILIQSDEGLGITTPFHPQPGQGSTTQKVDLLSVDVTIFSHTNGNVIQATNARIDNTPR